MQKMSWMTVGLVAVSLSASRVFAGDYKGAVELIPTSYKTCPEAMSVPKLQAIAKLGCVELNGKAYLQRADRFGETEAEENEITLRHGG